MREQLMFGIFDAIVSATVLDCWAGVLVCESR
jgi:predicted nucleic acid-binding protein